MSRLRVTRRHGERVIIPTPLGPVVITLDTPKYHGQARLLFEAPESIGIFREEVIGNRPETVRTIWGELPVGQGGLNGNR